MVHRHPHRVPRSLNGVLARGDNFNAVSPSLTAGYGIIWERNGQALCLKIARRYLSCLNGAVINRPVGAKRLAE
jgi:hypothetical protein